MLGIKEEHERPVVKELLRTKTKHKGAHDVHGSVDAIPSGEVSRSLRDYENQGGNEGSIRDCRRNELKINTGRRGTKTKIDTFREHHHESTVPVWDLMSEESECEHWRNHLESVGIPGGSCGHGFRKSVGGSTSILHNWRTLDHDTNGQVNSSIIEGLQLEASPGTWSREKTKGFRSCGGPFPFQDEDEKMKSMEPTRRSVQGHLLKRNEPVFSPLVLDPGEDMHSFVHSKQSFILEEPFHYSNEVYDSVDEAVVNEYGTCERKPSARPRTHHLSSHESRTQRQLSGNMSNGGKKMQMLRSSASYMAGKRRHLSIRPIALESDLFDHDLNKIEWPFEKDGGLQHPSKHLKKPDARHLFTGRENFGLPPDSRSSTKLKGGLSSKVQPLPLHQQSKRGSHPAIKTEVDPFPIFPELEGYNGSDDELVPSSNGGTSMGALEGELDLEPYNDVPDGHNTGRIVGLSNVGECQLAIPDGKELIICEYKPRNLSQKYRPKVFEDMVGQRIVTQALSNALSKGKIAPVYLFQGSRGTGKTTAARIFASALLCLSNDMQKPCGICKECIGVFQSTCPEVREVDAASNNGIESVKALLEETLSANRSLYKVFIIEECHVLATETWNALLKILEEPPANVVFILITTDPDRLPRTVVSRCHKFLFPKIRDSDIVTKLQKLAALENLAVDAETLQLIASRSDGSLRDAEIMLDQVSLLGQQINSSTVQELVGSASDEKVLSLLDSALQASTVTTVRKVKELIDSGLEPLSLMSQLAALITDILAGCFKFTDKQRKGFFHRQNFSEGKLERLRMAMRTLSEAEKQLRACNDRATWLTAALLQLGPDCNSYICSTSCVGTSVTQSPVNEEGENEEGTDIEHNYHHPSEKQTWEAAENNEASSPQTVAPVFWNLESRDGLHGIPNQEEIVYWVKGSSSQGGRGKDLPERDSHETAEASEKIHFQERLKDGSFIRKDEVGHLSLDDIWHGVIEKCRLQPLKQFLCTSVNPVSIEISEVGAIVNLEVCYPDHKLNCDRSQKCIANLFESVLGYPVEIRSSLASSPWCTAATGGYEKRSKTFGVDPTSMHDVRSLYPNQAIHDKLLSGNCMRDTDLETERSIGDIEALSLESHELTFLQDKGRSTSTIINGRKSYDAYPPKMGIGNFGMADRLSVRNHADILNDKSDSLMKFPRFPTKDMHTQPMQIRSYTEAPEKLDSHKKGKFKSTFARFFQGKLSKHGEKQSIRG